MSTCQCPVYSRNAEALQELEKLASEVIEHHYQCDGRYEEAVKLEDLESYKHLLCLKKRKLNTEETSQVFRDEHLLASMIDITKHLMESLSELHRDFRSHLEPITSRLSKDVSSLSDDILSLIFRYACSTEGGTRQAVWLSHVSRTFRRVALGTCHLWTTLHSNATRNELEEFITRSGSKLDLNIIVSKPCAGELDTLSFMDICVPFASRWSSLTIWSEEDASEDDEDPVTVDEAMAHVVEHYQLVLPRLQELTFTQCRYDIAYDEDSWTTEKFHLPWVTPNLRTILCFEYIPLSSPAYSSLRSFCTSFSLTSEEYTDRFDDLFAFLNSERSITDLDLTIRTPIQASRLHPLHIVNTTCSSLTSLTIRLPSFIFPITACYVIDALMLSLHMPNLESYSIFVEFRYDDLLADDSDHEHFPPFCDIMHTLLPWPRRSNITSLNVDLTHTAKTTSWRASHISRKELVIPLQHVPRVSTLSIKTFCDVDFVRSNMGADEILLREVHLHECETWEIEALQRTIASLKKIGVWDNLESFKVERCFSEDMRDEVLEAVGEERLTFVPRTTGPTIFEL